MGTSYDSASGSSQCHSQFHLEVGYRCHQCQGQRHGALIFVSLNSLSVGFLAFWELLGIQWAEWTMGNGTEPKFWSWESPAPPDNPSSMGVGRTKKEPRCSISSRQRWTGRESPWPLWVHIDASVAAEGLGYYLQDNLADVFLNPPASVLSTLTIVLVIWAPSLSKEHQSSATTYPAKGQLLCFRLKTQTGDF